MVDTGKNKIQKLKEIMAIANEGLTREEFVKSFEAVLKIILDLEKNLIERNDKKTADTLIELNSLRESFKGFIEKAKRDSESTFGGLRRSAIERVDNAFVKSDVNRRLTKALEAVDIVLEKAKELKDGKDADEELIIERLKKLIPDESTPEEIRDALETLEGAERLKIEAIHNLREELDRLEKIINTKNTGGVGGGIIGRDFFKQVDISSQLDGVTKTFNVPAMWTVLSVVTSSFPHALRPTIDYTFTSTTITFTDQIEAAGTLAAGQTVILTVVRG